MRATAMENEPEKPVVNTTHAEEIVKEELAREQKERAKAGRLLRFSLAQVTIVGIFLILGLALLAYILKAPPALMAIIGGSGAIVLTIFLIFSPIGKAVKHE